jgi:hypothetical protein
MGNSPYDFVMNASEKDLEKLENKAVHRTFSGEDFKQFLFNLKSVYTEFESLFFYFKKTKKIIIIPSKDLEIVFW